MLYNDGMGSSLQNSLKKKKKKKKKKPQCECKSNDKEVDKYDMSAYMYTYIKV